MKIKNILSSVLAVALSLTSVASVFAYTAPASVKVEVNASQYSDAEVADFGVSLPEGTGYYNLDFSISELGDITRTVTKSGRNDVVSGWGIVKVEMKCIAPDGKTLNLDFDNSTAPSKAGNANSSEYNGVQLLYNGASVEGFLPTAAGTITALSNSFFNIDVIASLGATITIQPSFTYQEFAESAAKGEAQRVVCEPITVALPGASTPDPDPDPDPQDPTVEEVEPETAAGITAYTVSTLAEKVIMTKTFQNVAVKPGMGLVVTNNGVTREFGGDLYAVLGSPEEGTVTIGSLTFGLVVEDTASASQFTFELR